MTLTCLLFGHRPLKPKLNSNSAILTISFDEEGYFNVLPCIRCGVLLGVKQIKRDNRVATLMMGD